MLLNLRAVTMLSFNRSTIDFEKVRDAILIISIDGMGWGRIEIISQLPKNNFCFFGI